MFNGSLQISIASLASLPDLPPGYPQVTAAFRSQIASKSSFNIYDFPLESCSSKPDGSSDLGSLRLHSCSKFSNRVQDLRRCPQPVRQPAVQWRVLLKGKPPHVICKEAEDCAPRYVDTIARTSLRKSLDASGRGDARTASVRRSISYIIFAVTDRGKDS